MVIILNEIVPARISSGRNDFYTGGGGPRRPIKPNMRNTTNITKNKKNNIFAIPAAATAMPPKPNAAAIIAMIKKTSAKLNMIYAP